MSYHTHPDDFREREERREGRLNASDERAHDKRQELVCECGASEEEDCTCGGDADERHNDYINRLISRTEDR